MHQLLRHATRARPAIGSLSNRTYSANAFATQSSDFIAIEPLEKHSKKARKALDEDASHDSSFSAKLRARTTATHDTNDSLSPLRQQKKLKLLKKKVEKLERRKGGKAIPKVIPEAIAAAQEAISRGQSSQENILKTLAQAIEAEKKKSSTITKKKGGKEKSTKFASKSPKVDTSALFQHLLAGPSSSDLSAESANLNTVEEEGWNKEGWYDVDWPKDELSPLKSEMDADSAMSRGEEKEAPPQQKRMIPYTRRIEGLLQTKGETVLQDLASPSEHKPVAKLAHGLDRVLFNQGVHWLQDPRSGVYNFTPWLESIPDVKDFAFERVTGFIRSSGDNDLWNLAKQEHRPYVGSTSSLTGMMSQIYFLISEDREVNTNSLSRHFQYESQRFTPGQRMPVTVNLNYKDGVYAFDSASSELSEKNVLTWMGTMLEKFLTAPPEEFKSYLREAPPLTEDEVDDRREAYRYSKSKKFIMRSQLDCIDNRLPGTGVFDLKTRAAVPIRLDMLNYEENSGYLIRTLQGPLESFEKEYFDLIRSAFLKYSMQVRIGNMDGVMVAYHNTARLFGFQYVSLEEMDMCLFGAKDRGDRVFEKCVGLLEEVADEIVRTFPEQSLKCTFETEEGTGVMRVFVEPLAWDPSKGAWPIAQLDVHVTSYLKDREVNGARAVSEAQKPWMIHWKISTSSSSDLEIRERLSAVQDRQFRAWALPAGVGYEDMEEHWKSMKFGGEPEKPGAVYKSSYVREATHGVEILRGLARAGRKETEQLALMNAGKAPIVWGEPDQAIPPLDDIEGRVPSGTIREAEPSVVSDGPLAVALEELGDAEVEQQELIVDGSAAQHEESDESILADSVEVDSVSGHPEEPSESQTPEGPTEEKASLP